MHRLATTIAVFGMLVLAAVGYYSGLTMTALSIRAVVGAAVLYVAARVGLSLMVAIMVSAVMSSTQSKPPERARSERAQ